MENKTFSLYFALYASFAMIMIIIPFMISLITILAKIGMTAIISFFVIISIGLFFLISWMCLFYLTNLVFYLKKQYPHKSDNLLVNTFSNIIVVIVLMNVNEYMVFFTVIPVINLLINFKCFLHSPIRNIEQSPVL